jgi:hypothetical protein
VLLVRLLVVLGRGGGLWRLELPHMLLVGLHVLARSQAASTAWDCTTCAGIPVIPVRRMHHMTPSCPIGIQATTKGALVLLVVESSCAAASAAAHAAWSMHAAHTPQRARCVLMLLLLWCMGRWLWRVHSPWWPRPALAHCPLVQVPLLLLLLLLL